MKDSRGWPIHNGLFYPACTSKVCKTHSLVERIDKYFSYIPTTRVHCCFIYVTTLFLLFKIRFLSYFHLFSKAVDPVVSAWNSWKICNIINIPSPTVTSRLVLIKKRFTAEGKESLKLCSIILQSVREMKMFQECIRNSLKNVHAVQLLF